MPGPQAWVDSLAAQLRDRPGVELTYRGAGRRPPGALRGGPRPLRSGAASLVRIARRPDRRELAPPAHAARDPARRRHARRSAGGRTSSTCTARRAASASSPVCARPSRWSFRSRASCGRTSARTSQAARRARSPGWWRARRFVKGRGVVHRYILLRRQAVREVHIMREARSFIGRTAWDREVLAAVNPSRRVLPLRRDRCGRSSPPRPGREAEAGERPSSRPRARSWARAPSACSKLALCCVPAAPSV